MTVQYMNCVCHLNIHVPDMILQAMHAVRFMRIAKIEQHFNIEMARVNGQNVEHVVLLA